MDKAEKGMYNSKSLSFRKMPYGMLDKYFDLIGDDYKVKDEIREIVKFKNLNMFDNNIEHKIGMADIILCRNVLIYFDTEFIKKAALSFYNILNENGYLFLGHAETVTSVNPGFDTIYTPSIFYYKKGENE
ncbi:chemotaxis methyl-accepting protein methylase [Clostridium saccharobutylicum]|nr:chemotaxis methyl-accepting protein methylase [Clostridium saccharobutylicum]